MTLAFNDDTLQAWGFENEAAFRLEMAIWLFQQERVSLGKAAELAGLNRFDFEAELKRRNLPAYVYTEEMFQQDLETIKILPALP
jgi:predicted HTH domain antitoxin